MTKKTLNYENEEKVSPTVPMPGTPAQDVKLRDNPGRKAPSVPPPGSNKMQRSNRISSSTLQSATTPFHSTTSTGFFSFEEMQNSKTASVFSTSSEKSNLPHDLETFKDGNQAVIERMRKNEADQQSTLTASLIVPDRPGQCASPQSSNSENVMTETRADLLQGIRAMDDSIQTLKDEMNKLMSVYEHVKVPANDGNVENVSQTVEHMAIDVKVSLPEKPHTPLITEAGQSVLEVVGDDELIRFKDFGSFPLEEATTSANLTLTPAQETESEYNSELGVYHENEISGQQTLSPKPLKKSFKNIR